MNEFHIVEVEAFPHLYVDCNVNTAEIDTSLMSAFDQVWKFMVKHGVAPAGGALTIFAAPPTDTAHFRAGFLIDQTNMKVADGQVQAGLTKSGHNLHFTHHGSYDDLPALYLRLQDYAEKQNLPIHPMSWQIYPNDISMVPEHQLLTECYQSVALSSDTFCH